MPKTVETRVGVCYNDFKYCTKGETGMLISLVVPCYNEEESLPIFYKEASKIAQQMEISHGADFEFIFVDDGSKTAHCRSRGNCTGKMPVCGTSPSAGTLARKQAFMPD